MSVRGYRRRLFAIACAIASGLAGCAWNWDGLSTHRDGAPADAALDQSLTSDAVVSDGAEIDAPASEVIDVALFDGATDGPCGSLGQACCAGATPCIPSFGCVLSGICAGCPSGQTACNGFCVDLSTDAANCGHCGTACGSGRSCGAGVCTTACSSPLTPCGPTCVNLGSDLSNCGTCGNSCPLAANAMRTCSGGSCSFTCIGSAANCNGLAADGCEANLSSTSNCGACGVTCPFRAHASIHCAGSCGFTCDAGYGDCNGSPADGCEAALNTTSNCGACGASCGAVPNATATCSGRCVPLCMQYYGDCDGNYANGCETQLTDTTHCGSCTHPCLPSQICGSGTCV